MFSFVIDIASQIYEYFYPTRSLSIFQKSFCGYSCPYEYHGPLELILCYVDVYSLHKSVIWVSKDFYVASEYSYLGRKVSDFGRKKIIEILENEKYNESMERFLIKLMKFDCIDFWVDVIEWSCKCNCLKLLKVLLKNKNVDPSVNENSPLRWACFKGSKECVELLLKDPRVDPTDKDNSSIVLACEYGFQEISKLLLNDPRVDPTVCKNRALYCATLHKHPEIIKLLLKDERIDPSFNYNQLFIEASANGLIEIVKILLKDPRVNPCQDDNDALRQANYQRNNEMVSLLMSDKRIRNHDHEEYLKMIGDRWP